MAGKNIKGITIEIDGNATGLDKALKGVNNTSVKLNTELGQVNKLLKFDPSNVTGLSQKQELLTKSIENTSDKLNQLKSAQSQVEAQYKSGNIGEEQYRAFQREIATTEQSLNGYKTQLSGLQSEQDKLGQNTKRLNTFFEASGKSINDFSDILGTKMVNSIKNGTASSDQLEMALNKIAKEALGAGGDFNKFKTALDGIKNGNSLNDVKQSLSELAPEAGKSEKAIEDMADSASGSKMMQATEVLSGVGDKIKELADSARESSMEFGSAFGNLNATTNLSGEELEKLKGVATEVFKSGVTDSIEEATEATSTMKSAFSDLNNQDLQHLTEQVMTLSKRTGTDVKENVRGTQQLMNAFGLDSKQAFDLVASGYQNGLNYSDDFMDTLNEYAPVFSAAGFSSEEMFTILENGMKNGAMNTDKTADAVKELQIRIGDGTFEKNMGMFSESTKGTFSEWKKGNATVADVAKNISADLKTMSPEKQQQAVSALSSQFEDLGLRASSSLFDVGNQFDNVGGKLDSASKKDPAQEWQASLNDLKTSLQEIGTEVTKSLKPLLDFVVDLAKKFNGLSTPVKQFIMVFSGILVALSVIAPIIAAVMSIGLTVALVAAGIGIAIGAIILIIMNWGAIVDWLQGVWQAFSSWIGDLWNGMKQLASDVWNGMKDTISNVCQGIADFVSGIWQGIKDTTSNVFNGIKDFMSGIWDGIKNMVSNAVDGVKNTISNVWDGIKIITSSAWDGIKSMITDPLETAKGVIKGIVDAIKGFFSFSITWPKIPMPHFSINPAGWEIGDLLKGKIPSLGVDWFANGGILTKPTIFGQNGNSLMVGGEAGKEAVAPLSDLMAYVEAAVANQIGDMSSNFAQMIQLLSIIASKETSFDINGKTLIKETAQGFKEEFDFIDRTNSRMRGFA